MGAAASAVPNEKIEHLPVTALKPSKFNYRKTFEHLDELADSVKAQGILQPLTVRTAHGLGGGHEIVFGERRWLAAKKAKLETVPCIVRTMTDQQVCEAQLVENAQRDDVHPVEEAEGYGQLIKDFGYTYEKLAERTGKSKSTIEARVKLLELSTKVRKACLDGEIGASIALLIARVPDHGLQDRVLGELGGWGGSFTVRQVSDHIQRRYMLQLGEAPFDTADEKLVAAAGTCAKCPKRTGNQRELFADVQSKDLCTDPGCYKQKANAAWTARAAEAKKQGLVVLDDKAGARAIAGATAVSQGEYIKLDEKIPGDTKYRPLRQILGKHTPQPVLARDDSGKVVELMKREEATKALAAAGVTRDRPNDAHDKAQREAAAKRKVHRVVVGVAVGELVDIAEKMKPTLEVLRGQAAQLADIALDETVRRRGAKTRAELVESVADMTEAQLRGLIFEVAYGRAAWTLWSGSYTDDFKKVCKSLDVDLKTIEADLKKGKAEKAKAHEEKAKAAPKAKSPKAKSKKK